MFAPTMTNTALAATRASVFNLSSSAMGILAQTRSLMNAVAESAMARGAAFAVRPAMPAAPTASKAPAPGA